jgi:hypothetical protein
MHGNFLGREIITKVIADQFHQIKKEPKIEDKK